MRIPSRQLDISGFHSGERKDTMDPKLTKLRIKLPIGEFEAEGDSASVQQQFELFLAALNSHSARESQKEPANLGNGAGTLKSPTESLEAQVLDAIDDAMLQRLFSLDENNIVSLRIRPPQGENLELHAVILLLYGFRRLKNEVEVMATKLAIGLRQSGVNIARFDRLTEPHSSLILKGGAKKGMRYQLTNPGVLKAEEIARSIPA